MKDKARLDFIAETFTNPVTRIPYDVPPDIKNAAIQIAGAYGIKGLCDHMYIANVIAHSIGRGDGTGNFVRVDYVSVSMGRRDHFAAKDELAVLFPQYKVKNSRIVDGESVFDLERA